MERLGGRVRRGRLLLDGCVEQPVAVCHRRRQRFGSRPCVNHCQREHRHSATDRIPHDRGPIHLDHSSRRGVYLRCVSGEPDRPGIRWLPVVARHRVDRLHVDGERGRPMVDDHRRDGNWDWIRLAECGCQHDDGTALGIVARGRPTRLSHSKRRRPVFLCRVSDDAVVHGGGWARDALRDDGSRLCVICCDG